MTDATTFVTDPHVGVTGVEDDKDVNIDDDLLGDLEEEVVPLKYSITSYGADYVVDVLIRRIEKGDIYIPTFQRGYVWTHRTASRFIESLLLELPVPGIFLSKEGETQRHLVIDGQQRLRTLQYFYDGIFTPLKRSFSLTGVQPRFAGLTYKTLEDDDRRRLDDSIIHATIIKQDDPSDDESSIYHIFERLNTGGTSLLPQEIRTAIYHGPFNMVLDDLNRTAAWRSIYGDVSPRMRDQELILRFLAFNSYRKSYKAPMKDFLNRYMGSNRNLDLQNAEELRRAFVPTVEQIFAAVGSRAFKPGRALNAAVFDSVMVGVAQRLERGALHDIKALGQAYEGLLNDPTFQSGSTRATANEQRVKERFEAAIVAFRDLP